MKEAPDSDGVRSRPVGTAQAEVLVALDGYLDGYWTPERGSVYENKAWTEKIMESLALRGLVTHAYGKYELTDAGRAYVRRLIPEQRTEDPFPTYGQKTFENQ